MSATPGNKWQWAIRSNFRHGTDKFGQSSDGTGLDGDLAAFNENGSVTDSGISIGSILNLGGGSGSIYGQAPIGAINGSNKTFVLDFSIIGRYPLLTRNGISQNPPNDGPRANPNPQFNFVLNTNVITFVTAPTSGDELYIWYIAGVAGITVTSASITLWDSFTGGTTEHAFAVANFSYPPTMPDEPVSLHHTNAFFPLTETTFPLTVPLGATVSSYTGSSIVFVLDGSLGSDGDSNFINIYDVFITLNLAGSLAPVIIRPTSYTFSSGSGGGFVNAWLPDTAYVFGGNVIDGNGNIQLCSVSGTSGGSPPAWAFSGNTIDGTVTWSFVGPQTSDTGQIQNPTFAYDVDTAPPSTFAVLSQLDWGSLATNGNFTVVF